MRASLYPKIDTIDMLIEQKRWNTRRLLETWRETNAEHLYTQNIEKVIARQDTMIRQVEIQERVIVHQDSVKTPHAHNRLNNWPSQRLDLTIAQKSGCERNGYIRWL